MGQKDLSQKHLETYPDVFADTVNALLYRGKRVVCAEELQEAPTETLYRSKYGRLRNQFHDVSKYVVRQGIVQAQYTLENEMSVKRNTVLRKAGYGGAIYREQYDGKAKELFPFIGLLLYWGKRKWNVPDSLHQLLPEGVLLQGTEEYVDDVKLHIYEMAHLPLKIRRYFRSDMRIVVDYLAEGKNYVPTKQKICHLEEVILLLRALTGDERYTDILPDMQEKEKEKGAVNMCELLDKYENQGIEKGMERVNLLIRTLIGEGRSNEIQRVVSDKDYQGQLFAEYGL
ncbi:MAG: hypothetical protein ACI4EQ_07295 [Lachnospiraceae bacterium]